MRSKCNKKIAKKSEKRTITFTLPLKEKCNIQIRIISDTLGLVDLHCLKAQIKNVEYNFESVTVLSKKSCKIQCWYKSLVLTS